MPLYEYECQACHHRLEVQQRLADAPLVKCPSCGKDQLEKVISATAFVLKGGGWYKDLYSSTKPAAPSADAAPSSGADSSSSSPSAPAPAAPAASSSSSSGSGSGGSSGSSGSGSAAAS